MFEVQRKIRVQKEKRKGVKDPQQVLSEDLAAKEAKEQKKAKAAAKAAAKAKSGAKAKAKAAPSKANGDLPEDEKESESVTLTGTGGAMVARPKLFADCLILGIRNAIKEARKKFGLPRGVEEEDLIPDTASDPFKYTDEEINIMRPHVRAGLIFALQGSHMFNGKVHKKWSSLRPALQSHIIESYKQA